MPIFQTWAIAHAITNTFHSIAKLCTLFKYSNKGQGYNKVYRIKIKTIGCYPNI
jgi:hypothetical protein